MSYEYRVTYESAYFKQTISTGNPIHFITVHLVDLTSMK